MKQLIIIGASALGRETCSYAWDCGMEVKGFIDSRADILSGFSGYPPILSSVNDYVIEDNDVFVCAVGDSSERRKYTESILNKGGCFVSVVHPSAIVGANAKVGEGCILRPYSVVGNDVHIGNHVIVGTQALVAHDCNVCDYVTISPGCHVAGWCSIGDGAFLGIHSAVAPHLTLGGGICRCRSRCGAFCGGWTRYGRSGKTKISCRLRFASCVNVHRRAA